MTTHHIPPPTQERLLAILTAVRPDQDDLWRLMVAWMRSRIDPSKPLHGEMVAALGALVDQVQAVADEIDDAECGDGVVVWEEHHDQ